MPLAGLEITNISTLRRFFTANRRPIYSFGATDFNLAGMDEWIANFRHVCQIDSYDRRNVVVALLCSQPKPFESDGAGDVQRACAAISSALTLLP